MKNINTNYALFFIMFDANLDVNFKVMDMYLYEYVDK